MNANRIRMAVFQFLVTPADLWIRFAALICGVEVIIDDYTHDEEAK